MLRGEKISLAKWLPGQPLKIGSYTFELTPMSVSAPEIIAKSAPAPFAPAPPPAPSAPPAPAFSANPPSIIRSRLDDQQGAGRIKLGDVFQRAKSNDRQAVQELFNGFLGKTEQVVDCGYLGALGFIFPEHSFWCVTNSRVCGLLVNRGGWMNFNFGFIKSLDRGVFTQPSIIWLWILLILWGLFMVISPILSGFQSIKWAFQFDFAFFWGAVLSFVIAAIGVVLIPWVVRAYYRWVKAGCVFWTRELVPIIIYADRNSLQDAQRFITVYTDQKQNLGS